MSQRRRTALALGSTATLQTDIVQSNLPTKCQPLFSSRPRIIFIPVRVADRSLLYPHLIQALPSRSLVGVGSNWCSADRFKLENAPNTLEEASRCLTQLLGKLGRAVSIDIVVILGSGSLPVPEDALELFHGIDSALNEDQYHAHLRIICMQDAILNDWDLLLGASVIRLNSFDCISLDCLVDSDVILRGSLLLAKKHTISGIFLTLDRSCKGSTAMRTFPSIGCQKIQVLARVRLDSVPVILFRRSLFGQMKWNASRSLTHRLLSLWSQGQGIMSEGHGLFLQISGGPILLLYPCNGRGLFYRTLCPVEEEAKLSSGGLFAYLWMHSSCPPKANTSCTPEKLTVSCNLKQNKHDA